MKIFDIISEETYVRTPSGIMVPQGSSSDPEKVKADAQAQQRKKAADDSAARRQKAADIRKDNPVSTSAKDATKKVAKVQGDIGQYITGKQKTWRANQRLFRRLEAKWMRLYGRPLTWLMKLIGIGTALTFLYLDLESFEQEYANGLFDKAQYEAGREFLFGTFMVQVLAPALVRRLSQTFIVVGIIRVITWIAGGLSAGVTAGASVAALIASEAFFTWFQMYLSSSAGKDFLVDWLTTNVIRTMGKIPEGAVSAFTDAYNKADTAKLKKQDPEKAKEVERQAVQDKSDLEKAQAFRKELERSF